MVHSLKYDNAPMPHSIFFREGYALHGSNLVRMLGHPASHGCIRLVPGNAGVLFDLVKRQGATISISGATPVGGLAKARGRTVLGHAPHRRARPPKAWADDPLGL